MNKHNRVVIAWSLLIVSSACQAATPSPTPTPMASPTATATLTPSETPTATRTPVPTLDQTAVAEAETREAAALVPESIALDLELAGYTTGQGQLAWMQSEELALFNEVANDLLSQPLEPGFTAANFIFSTDIDWNFEGLISTYGYTTCGVIFRAKDVDSGEQAQFNVIFINPLAYPAWDIELWNHGEYQSTMGNDLNVGGDIQQAPPYQGAYGDPKNPFRARNTNHFLIVADGSTVTVFANGTQLDQANIADGILKISPSVTLNASLNKGEFGILAGALYGRKWYEADPSVSCIFTNTWVWELP